MVSPSFSPSCCGCGVLGLKSGGRRSGNNSAVVMEVWKTQVATVYPDKKTVSFNTCIKYDKGDHPSIALNNKGKVFELHETYSGTSLWYNVGRIEDSSISFPGEAKHYDEGHNSFIDNSNFVAMHKSNSSDTL